MNSSVSISGNRGRITLEVLGYENAQAQSADDSNWLRATLEVKGGPFTGVIQLVLTAVELAALHDELSGVTKLLTGTVRFETMEGNWTFNLDFERSGTAVVTGSVTAHLVEKNLLQYEFRTDPISLESLVRDLGRLVVEYPASYAAQ